MEAGVLCMLCHLFSWRNIYEPRKTQKQKTIHQQQYQLAQATCCLCHRSNSLDVWELVPFLKCNKIAIKSLLLIIYPLYTLGEIMISYLKYWEVSLVATHSGCKLHLVFILNLINVHYENNILTSGSSWHIYRHYICTN